MSRATPQDEVNTMVLEAVVKDDGTLIAQAPESLRGQRVKIIVKTGAAATSRSKKLAQWENMTRALRDIDALELPPTPDSEQAQAAADAGE